MKLSQNTKVCSQLGATMVESVMVLLIIMTFVFVATEVSRYMVAKAVLQSAAQDASGEIAVDVRLSPDTSLGNADAIRYGALTDIRKRAQARVLQSGIFGDIGSSSSQSLVGGHSTDLQMAAVQVTGPIDSESGALTNPAADQESLFSTIPFEVKIDAQFQPMLGNFLSLPINMSVQNKSLVYREPRLAYAYPAALSCARHTSGPLTGQCLCATDPSNTFVSFNPETNTCQCTGLNVHYDATTRNCICDAPPQAAGGEQYIYFDSATGTCQCDVTGFTQYCKDRNLAFHIWGSRTTTQYCYCQPCLANSVYNPLTAKCDCTITAADCPPNSFVPSECVCVTCQNNGVARSNSCDCSASVCPRGASPQFDCSCRCDAQAGLANFSDSGFSGCAALPCVTATGTIDSSKCTLMPDGTVIRNG